MDDEPGIRATLAGDAADLKDLYGATFPAEPLWPLVERLLADVPRVLSLAAVRDDRCVGHVLFTPCGVGDPAPAVALLGPLAVAPSRQGQGIGGALVREGLSRLGGTDLRHALVLGDPAYYGRFGFRPDRHIVPPYALPAAWSDAWQSVPLRGHAEALSGELRPPAPWLSPSLWAP